MTDTELGKAILKDWLNSKEAEDTDSKGFRIIRSTSLMYGAMEMARRKNDQFKEFLRNKQKELMAIMHNDRYHNYAEQALLLGDLIQEYSALYEH